MSEVTEGLLEEMPYELVYEGWGCGSMVTDIVRGLVKVPRWLEI